MRAFLYDTLTHIEDLEQYLGGDANEMLKRVMPRRSKQIVPDDGRFLIYGLGNSSDERLGDPTANDVRAERQFFQVWVHDPADSFVDIDDMVEIIKRELVGLGHPPSEVITIAFLETSQEFNNETYNTNFRYIRFQAIKGKAQ